MTTTAASPRPDTARRAGRATRVAAQTGMELRLLLRNGENLLVTFGIPLGLLVFFSLVPVLPTRGEPAVDFLVPGVLVASVMGSSLVSLGISTGFDRAYLVLKRLGATPLRRGELVAAKSAAVLAVQAVQVAAVVAVALALGWSPAVTAAGLLLSALALLTSSIAFAGLGLALAGGLPAMATLAATNAAFVVLLACSGLLVPLDSLPDALVAGARLAPSTWAAEALRAGLGDGPVTGGSAFTALGVLTGWAVGAVAVAARVFRWE